MYCCPDEWGSTAVDYKGLLDRSTVWEVTFDDFNIARRGGAPLLNISDDHVTNGTVSVERVAAAASPAVHRVIVRAESMLDVGGYFELSLAGVKTRPVSIEASADTLQHVSVSAWNYPGN